MLAQRLSIAAPLWQAARVKLIGLAREVGIEKHRDLPIKAGIIGCDDEVEAVRWIVVGWYIACGYRKRSSYEGCESQGDG